MVYGRTAQKPARNRKALPPGVVVGPILADASSDAVTVREHARVVLGGTGRTDEDGAIAGALVALASVARDEGRLADALAFLAAAVERSDPGLDGSPALASRVALVGALCAAGDFDEADRAVVDVDRAVRRAGGASWRPAGPVCAARVALARGRLERAATEAGRGLRLAKIPEARVFAPTARACSSASRCGGAIWTPRPASSPVPRDATRSVS